MDVKTTQIVTKISPQKRRKGRVNIYLDGEFWTGAPERVLDRVEVGQKLTAEEKADLAEIVSSEEGLAWAFNYLSRWPSSENRFREKLADREYSESIIDRIIELSKEYGLIHDQLLAEGHRESSLSQGRPSRWLQNKLRQKGFTLEMIREVTEDYPDDAALERCLDKDGEKTPPHKLAQRLIRQGFSWTMVQLQMTERGLDPRAPRKEPTERDQSRDVEKALRRYDRKDPKAVAYLIRRGWNYQEAKRALSADE